MAGDLKALLVAAAGMPAGAVPLAAGTGLALVPLPGEIPEHVEEPEQARRLSAHGTVAYVHSEFFGGEGFQAAVAWRDGRVVWGPVYTATSGGVAEEPYAVVADADLAINRLLRWLGVRPAAGGDEFAAAGLDRFRWTEEWEPGGGPRGDARPTGGQGR